MEERELVKEASERARERASTARWDINIAILLFAVLIAVVVLSFSGVPIELVSLVGFAGLVICWILGWRRGQKLYPRYFLEEMEKLQRGQGKAS